MIYLYAYTNFKEGLDSLRRIKVIYEALKEQGKSCEILINDYRAQLVAKDWGLPLATTIETIKDIDAVADVGDVVIIDSIEVIEGKVLNYPNKFEKVIYLNSKCQNTNFEGAIVVDIYKKENLIAPSFEFNKNSKKSIFIYGDSDYEKRLLKNADKFQGLSLDLYFGIYFFVKYEDELAKIFNNLIEAEDYYETILEYEYIITSSFQVAIESLNSGANVLFLELNEIDKCHRETLETLGIKIVNKLTDDYIEYMCKIEKNISNLNTILSYV